MFSPIFDGLTRKWYIPFWDKGSHTFVFPTKEEWARDHRWVASPVVNLITPPVKTKKAKVASGTSGVVVTSPKSHMTSGLCGRDRVPLTPSPLPRRKKIPAQAQLPRRKKTPAQAQAQAFMQDKEPDRSLSDYEKLAGAAHGAARPISPILFYGEGSRGVLDTA